MGRVHLERRGMRPACTTKLLFVSLPALHGENTTLDGKLRDVKIIFPNGSFFGLRVRSFNVVPAYDRRGFQVARQFTFTSFPR